MLEQLGVTQFPPLSHYEPSVPFGPGSVRLVALEVNRARDPAAVFCTFCDDIPELSELPLAERSHQSTARVAALARLCGCATAQVMPSVRSQTLARAWCAQIRSGVETTVTET